jgi:LmbE family N-acetylglucosaminyl deacetylase
MERILHRYLTTKMKFSREEADVWVPGAGAPAEALARVTHLCVGAHQDDIEIMAHSGICDCLDNPDTLAFGGVVVTDGGGSSRTGPYADKTDEAMKVIRREEQRQAAALGQYAIQIQLAHPSADVKRSGHAGVAADLATIFAGAKAQVVYLHNPADKHDTHVAVLWRCLAALRALPAEDRPQQVFGVEVWRGLDWVLDAEKVALDCGRRPDLAAKLLEVFDSQITGGKRYDLAAAGRRAANATFNDARSQDGFAGIAWALDLTPLVADPSLDLATVTKAYVDRLSQDVADRLERFR